MADDFFALWKQAAGIDATLRLQKKDVPALRRKRILPESYSRNKLFSRMAHGQISLFYDLALPIKNHVGGGRHSYFSEIIKTGFPKTLRVFIQTGHSRRRYKVGVVELMRRWDGERAIMSVTDLHFRGTKFERVLDLSPLSDFNVLCADPELVDQIEMMTLVVSSKGNFTDNHADDCDGSNHCFVGKKLWLAWDRIEGMAQGFQDADRDADAIADQATFNMDAFISMPSSRWFVVKEDETLFLPGHLAHKVLTLERYIGVGSFHVALPGYIRSLRRWILYDTLDVGPKNLLGKINQKVILRVRRIQRASLSVKEHWGLGFMRKAIELWEEGEYREVKERLLHNPIFAAFLDEASQAR